MLQKLHEGIKGWVAAVIVVIISIAFVAWGITYYLGARSSRKATIVSVGSTKITGVQLDNLYQQQKRYLEAKEGVLSASTQKMLKEAVLNRLIQQALGSQALKKLGLVVPMSTAEAALKQEPAFQEDGVYSAAKLQQFLSDRQLTLSALLANISETLAQQQFSMGLQLGAFVLPSTLQGLHNWQDEKRQFRYAVVDPKQFKTLKSATNAQLKAYYQAHLSDYRLPERVKLAYVMLSPKAMRARVVVPPAAVREYYQAHPEQFRLPTTYRFAAITLASPETANPKAVKMFNQTKAKIAKALADGKQVQHIAAEFGGVVETKTALELSMPMLNRLDSMRNGQQLLQQPLGDSLVWLQLLSKKSGRKQGFSEVKGKIAKQLMASMVSKKMASMTQRLSEVSYMQSTTLKPAAKALNIPIHHTGFLSIKGGKGPILSNKKVINAAFSDDVLKQKNNSFPIALPSRTVVVIRVAEHKKAYQQTFDEVKSKVLKQFSAQSAALSASLFAANMQAMLNQGKSVKNIMQKKGIAWVKEAPMNRKASSSIPQPVLTAAFSLKQGKAGLAVLDKNGRTAVVFVETIQLPKQQVDLASNKSLYSTAYAMRAKLDAMALMQSVEKTVLVKRLKKAG